MGALSTVWVDPAIAADSGIGTEGDPYGDLQHALNTLTFDAANGTRIKIVPGTAEILTGILTIPFNPDGANSSLIIESSVAGTPADIDGNNGNFAIYGGAKTTIQWKNLKLHNTGTATALTLNDYSHIHNCEVYDAANGLASVAGKIYSMAIFGCNLHDISGIGIDASGLVIGNYLKNGSTKKFTSAIRGLGVGVIADNIISVDSSTHGILAGSYYQSYSLNSIYSAGGTGTGLKFDDLFAGYGMSTKSNVIEGFSGVGGIGVRIASDASNFTRHAVYNCATAYSYADQVLTGEDNETLSASPFAKSGADTFANRFVYFAPANTGNVWGGAYPSGSGRDKGAVQHAGGGGGVLIGGKLVR